jgi:hypothetical protein
LRLVIAEAGSCNIDLARIQVDGGRLNNRQRQAIGKQRRSRQKGQYSHGSWDTRTDRHGKLSWILQTTNRAHASDWRDISSD